MSTLGTKSNASSTTTTTTTTTVRTLSPTRAVSPTPVVASPTPVNETPLQTRARHETSKKIVQLRRLGDAKTTSKKTFPKGSIELEAIVPRGDMTAGDVVSVAVLVNNLSGKLLSRVKVFCFSLFPRLPLVVDSSVVVTRHSLLCCCRHRLFCCSTLPTPAAASARR